MKKLTTEDYILLGGGALLLWAMLSHKKSARTCPLTSVLQWTDLADDISQRYSNIYGVSITPNILAIIHDQSQGNMTFYWGERYGLCGVPLTWAREFTIMPEVKPTVSQQPLPSLDINVLLNPEYNIDMMVKIMVILDTRIKNAYGGGTGWNQVMSSNAYSAYVYSDTMKITDANDPAIHHQTKYLSLVDCYRK